jgi:hypothetical protein
MLALASVGVLSSSDISNCSPRFFTRLKADGPTSSGVADHDVPLVINEDRASLKSIRLGGRSYTKKAPEKDSSASGKQKPPSQTRVTEEAKDEIKEEVLLCVFLPRLDGH